MHGRIYKITNVENDKVYIGSTLSSLKYRFLQHHVMTGNKLHQAMKELGSNKFSISLLQNFHCVDRDELRKQENNFIILFDSIKTGYNSNRAYVSKATQRRENIERCSDLRKVWVVCECCQKAVDLSHKARHMRRHV